MTTDSLQLFLGQIGKVRLLTAQQQAERRLITTSVVTPPPRRSPKS
jgi:sigma-70-like protein